MSAKEVVNIPIPTVYRKEWASTNSKYNMYLLACGQKKKTTTKVMRTVWMLSSPS